MALGNTVLDRVRECRVRQQESSCAGLSRSRYEGGRLSNGNDFRSGHFSLSI